MISSRSVHNQRFPWPTEKDLRDALRCGTPKCPCRNPKGNVHCPAHDDDTPSLSVATRDGTVLVHCHADCSQQAVLEALAARGIEPKNRRQSVSSEPEAVYDYRDERGRLLFQVMRFPGKRFAQRQPCLQGGCDEEACRRGPDGQYWHWTLRGARLVLYRLPEVIEAVRSGLPVFVVEGEKDADALAGLGLAATTAPMGAGKWRPEYAEPLRGAQVIILPDNDEPGRRHAEMVAAELHGVAAEVKIVGLPGLPPRGDVSDWLGAGHTREELEELVATAPAWAHPEGAARGGEPGLRYFVTLEGTFLRSRRVTGRYRSPSRTSPPASSPRNFATMAWRGRCITSSKGGWDSGCFRV